MISLSFDINDEKKNMFEYIKYRFLWMLTRRHDLYYLAMKYELEIERLFKRQNKIIYVTIVKKKMVVFAHFYLIQRSLLCTKYLCSQRFWEFY